MKTEDVEKLISLMAAVCCCEIDGTINEFTHEVNNELCNYPEDIRTHFINEWITVSRCANLNKRK